MSSVYGNYYNKLLREFRQERGDYNKNYDDFISWLEKRNLMGEELIKYLNVHDIDYVNSRSVELNTGPLDSNVILNRHTMIISQYGSLFNTPTKEEMQNKRMAAIRNKIICGDFVSIDGEPIVLIGKKSINIRKYVDTYLSYNNIRDAFKLTKIYLNNPDSTMLIAFYGEKNDLDERQKASAEELIYNKVPESYHNYQEYELNKDNQTTKCYRRLILLPKKRHK